MQLYVAMYVCTIISTSEFHSKEVVCISIAGMDPEVPENRTKDRGEEKHHQDYQSVAEV